MSTIDRITHSEAVTPSDSVNLRYECSAIYVGTGGDVATVNETGTVTVYKNVPTGSYIYGEFRRVNATDTGASDMVASRGLLIAQGARGLPGVPGPPGGLTLTDAVTATAHGVAVNGPLLLQASGSVVLAAFIDNVILNDRDSGLVVGELTQIKSSSDNGMALVDTDLCWAQYVGPNAAVSAAAIPSGLNHAAIGDVVALWLTQVTALPVESAPGSWQANHGYLVGDMILDDQFTPKHFRIVSVAGTSGPTVPTWANFAPTTDNDVTWDDEGRVPASGQMDIRLIISS